MILEKIEEILKKADIEGRNTLTEEEVYRIFKILKLNLPEYIYEETNIINEKNLADRIISEISSDKVVLKIVSYKTLHKTESGGVKIIKKEKSEIEKTIKDLISKFKDINGILACQFLEHSPFSLGEELLLGSRSDDAFGPLLTFGVGGTHTEFLTKSLKSGLVPSIIPIAFAVNDSIWKEFLEESWIWEYCSGKVRGSKKLADEGEIIKWFEAFSYLLNNFKDNGNLNYAIEEMEVNPLCIYKGKFFALDGVLRFRKAKKVERKKPSKEGMLSILKPKTIGIIGVSEKKMNMARIILNNIIKAGFEKDKIFIVKEGVENIDGIKCYSSIFDVPVNLDMYVVAVPSSNVPEVIKQASDSNKVNGIILISGGMGEKSGSENLAEKVMNNIKEAKEKNPDFALSGGNSLGIVLNESKVNTLFIPEYKMEYPTGENKNMVKTAFVSQSGAFVISALSKMPHIKPLYSITVGNQQDITVVDYVERLIDEDIKLILIYIEGFKYGDGLSLDKIISKAKNKGKDMIIYKAGRTQIGQKAVMGHTASIAGDYIATKNILEKSGALVCEDFDEFCDLSFLFSYFSKFKIKSKNTFFISNAGFETAGMADNINFLIPQQGDKKLSDEIEKILKKYNLDTIVDFKNPMDVTPMACDDAISEILTKILESDLYSAAIVSMVPLTAALNTLPKSDKWPDDLEKSFIKNAGHIMRLNEKPIIFCVASGYLYELYCKMAIENGLVVFRSADRAVRMYEKFVRYKLSRI